MKRFLSMLLLSILLIGTLSTYAAPSTGVDPEMEKIVLKSKKIFNISSEYDKFDFYLSTYDDVKVYNLNWHDSKGKLLDIGVTIDSNQVIHSYYINDDSTTPSGNPISDEDAVKKADEYLKKICPEHVNELKRSESKNLANNVYDAQRAVITYYRHVSGIPFEQNYANITINRFTGELIHYEFTWGQGESKKDITFPDSKKIISIDEAKKVFEKEMGPVPAYIKFPSEEDMSKVEYVPVYTNLYADWKVNAVDGKPIPLNYFYGGYGNGVAEAKDAGMPEQNLLSPAEQAAAEAIRGLITAKDAENKLRTAFGIPADAILKNSHISKQIDSEKKYIYDFSFEMGEQYYGGAVDALTGQVVRYISYGKEGNQKYSYEQSKKVVEAIVDKVAAPYKGELELLRQGKSNGFTHNFVFVRKANGRYVIGDGITIEVNAKTNKIQSFFLNWYDGQLPKVDNEIGVEKAKELLWKNKPYRLAYYNENQHWEGKSNVKLVYDFELGQSFIIHANTGNFLDANGKLDRSINKDHPYTDWEKIVEKDKIKTLSDMGILYAQEEFNPEGTLLQKDFFSMLLKASGNYFQLQKLEKTLLSLKYLEDGEYKADEPITKLLATKAMIRSKHLDHVAKLEGIYKPVSNDTSSLGEDMGYINLAYGFGYLQKDASGKINPTSSLTREEGALMVYQFVFSSNR
ncbi:MAG: hypothetical protein GXZ11_02850 [Tissierellia bacterium]|nr:hypothetical protein [Tissierellia bacterium]